MPDVNLTKHHGLGNDFLVMLADDEATDDAAGDDADRRWAEAAVRWCDRRRGIGADGLLILADARSGTSATPADVTMVLYNADGSRAEMSGNGIRCLAQAWVRRRGLPADVEIRVATDAGLRTVAVSTTDDPDTVMASVSMGAVRTVPAPGNWAELACDPGRPVAHLSLGNPHAVVLTDDVGAVDLAALGAIVPNVNLEILELGPEPQAITMRVHERGAGITEACGTGACAAAWAASSWGLFPAGTGEITVHMDGGDAKVRLDAPNPGHVTLVGPSTYIGTVTVAATTNNPANAAVTVGATVGATVEEPEH